MPQCAVCSSSIGEPQDIGGATVFHCPRCGRWGFHAVTSAITDGLQRSLGNWNQRSIHLRSRLSHLLRQRQRNDGGYVQIPLLGLEEWKLEEKLPSPLEQFDELILVVGDHQPSPSESAALHASELSARIGATITRNSSDAGLAWLLSQNELRHLLLQKGAQQGALLLRLTMAGWARYDELKRGRIESRRVLMAMQFGDAELIRVVDECFRPAVARAGFELRILTDDQPAGLIDDQLRVALRTSRFVIADLTHANNGAYWEAGFAEGLGRPVIYTCRKNDWHERRTHFDTNHLVTILWDPADLPQAASQLTATIRATLPQEAVLADE